MFRTVNIMSFYINRSRRCHCRLPRRPCLQPPTRTFTAAAAPTTDDDVDDDDDVDEAATEQLMFLGLQGVMTVSSSVWAADVRAAAAGPLLLLLLLLPLPPPSLLLLPLLRGR